MTDDQRAMFTGVSMNYNTERSLFLTQNLILTMVNLAGVSALAVKPIPILAMVVASLGIMLSYPWLSTNFASGEMIRYWASCLATMERPEERRLITFRVFSGGEWEDVHERIERFSFLGITGPRLDFLPLFFSTIWLIITVAAAAMLVMEVVQVIK